ncbi:hypothetical protein CAPTEDRAFT_228655 [Capitella teleta]|uniref:FYVE-type domain-containing protein n=1 Tax=Capitella teleta TaxID=283909 RepID=R7UD29_CAPTE|nr:hypothetical protein CAPTEDRAFT_228655 [Capitella teleta]|eukprot:ELU03889.1 hypothetical protein CAPTEDRAFT_228655 [Capitella teleta]
MRKPELINKLEGINDVINMAVIIPREDGVISVSDDRTVRVWLKRDSGQYWPSICHSMASAASSLDLNQETRRLFIGQDNGTISEFQLSEDFNSMPHTRDYVAHQGRVTALLFALYNEWVLSCGRDKYFQWHCSETGRRLGGYQTAAWCTCLSFDKQTNYTFVGDFGGQITVLKVSNNGFEVITTLKGHSGSVRCLAWDEERNLLFSGSFDQSIIVWDIGGQKGTAFELQGHRDKVQTLSYSGLSRELLSSGDEGVLTIWDMNAKRQETPDWAESDACMKCGSPFFWNVKSMWEQKTIGVRQHHCRKCGQAICSKCSMDRSTIPVMGYEHEVRVCVECKQSITECVPMATFHDMRHAVLSMHLDVQKKQLLTVGKDRIIRLWDVGNILS